MNSSNNNATFSVIMTVYDEARKLEENLPLFLEQDYETGYEVIVVDESSTDDTVDVLKLQKAKYPHLYTTFLPKPNRLVTRQRLALTLGVKATKNEWIIFTGIQTPPPSDQWLKELAEFTAEGTALLLGYINRKTATCACSSLPTSTTHAYTSARLSANGPTATMASGFVTYAVNTTLWSFARSRDTRRCASMSVTFADCDCWGAALVSSAIICSTNTDRQ